MRLVRFVTSRRRSFIHFALDNEHQLASVFHGPTASSRTPQGTVLLVHSTVPPKACRVCEEARRTAAAARLADERANIAAQNGTLTFIVGGDAGLLARRPLLEAMGSAVFHLGPVGNGQVGKLVNGLMFHIGYVVTLEALKLSRAYDVPEETMIAVARVSTGDSWMVQHWGYMDKLLREHTKAGSETLIYQHIRKDIVDALIAADVQHTALQLAAAAYQIYPDFPVDQLAEKEYGEP